MTLKLDNNIINFFIFNPGLSKIEGEEEKKILYYYPHDVDKDVQLKNAGLCEALIKFTASFGPDKPCEVFCTEKTKQFFFEPEENFWMAMTIGSNGGGEKKAGADPSDNIEEKIGHSVLKMCYRMFFAFSGSFQSILAGDEVEGLKVILKRFFEKYLAEVHFEASNIFDVFQGIQYLPLGREPFLHVLSFINTVERNFPFLRHSAFLYNDHLVWSGLDPNDMQILYHYLVRNLLPMHPDFELQASFPGVDVSYGSFLTCPDSLMEKIASSSKAPKFYLHCDGSVVCFVLIIYRVLSATLCLFLPETTEITLDLMKGFEEQIGSRLTSLVSKISEHCVKNGPVAEPTAKFIYFNKLNLAIKSSALESRKNSPQALPPGVIQLLANVHADPALCFDNGEVMLKTENGSWIVAKFSNDREFYCLVPKKPNLRDVSVEVKKICNTQLKGIFFLS